MGDPMFRHRRLDACYDKSETIVIDESTKMIFFSDVHRGDNSMSDEFAHNQNIYYHALSQYYQEGFTYFELGDGDELWEHAKFRHVRQAHSDVYLLIQKFYEDNRLLYMFGNHNMALKNKSFVERHLEHFYDEYTEEERPLFPGIKIVEAIKLKWHASDATFLAVHGHQGDLMNDQFWPISMMGLRYFWRYMHMVGFQNPSSPSKNRTVRHKIENNFSKWIRLTGVGIICGHTHRPKLPQPHETPYLNTGCCIHPRGITGLELVHGLFYLVDWRIEPDSTGQLFIRKKIMRGPIPFDSYSQLTKGIDESATN